MRGRFFGPGEVRLALLSLIVEEPRHGYELMKELEARSGGSYRASAGSVYPTLQQLEDEGLVQSATEGGKRVYAATEAGRREAEAESEAVRDIWRRAEDLRDWSVPFQPEAMELSRPVRRLMRDAFRAVTRYEVDPDRVRDVLESARRDIEALVAARREVDEDERDD